jgi:hypothetical protein
LDQFDYTIRTLDWFRDLRYPDAPPALIPRTFVLSWVEDEPPIPDSGGDRKFYLLAPSRIEEVVLRILHIAGVDADLIKNTLSPQASFFFDHLSQANC